MAATRTNASRHMRRVVIEVGRRRSLAIGRMETIGGGARRSLAGVGNRTNMGVTDEGKGYGRRQYGSDGCCGGRIIVLNDVFSLLF